MTAENPAEPRRTWQAMRWWHWLFLAAALLYWTVGSDWADSAAHFGYELWPLLAVMFLTFISPIAAVADLYRSPSSFRSGSITRGGLWLRRVWAAALIVNWLVIAWQLVICCT